MIEWVIVALVAIDCYLTYTTRQSVRLHTKALGQLHQHNLESSRSRQSQMQSGLRSSRSVEVDARARTVRRDTDDLPHTGRMGRLPLSRRGGSHDGTDTDD